MISVVIPAFIEATELPATLAALRAQEVEHEVVVVDAESGRRALPAGSGFRVRPANYNHH